ncbi:MAG: DivIVA domain-containing protein [Balneolaceae bacterium]|nr:MAG: DivIVA domain-containing protein [Balneolaceae bacterium]
MKLTALEIKQQQFEKTLRGYDTAEVHSFLNLLATEWEHLVGKNRELEARVDQLNEKIKHYERVEEALHETLQTARSSAEEKLNTARNEARHIIEKSELEAETILQEAHRERWKIRQQLLQMIEKREEMIRSFKTYLENAARSLDTFSADHQTLFTLPESSDLTSSSAGENMTPTPKKNKRNSAELDELNADISSRKKIDDILDQLDS